MIPKEASQQSSTIDCCRGFSFYLAFRYITIMPKDIIKLEERDLLPKEQLRLATLNVLHSPLHAEKRFDFLINELNEIKPDVLHIQEANFSYFPDLIHKIAKDCGFKAMGKTSDIKARNSDNTSSNITLVRKNARFTELPVPNGESSLFNIPTLLTETTFNDLSVYTFNVHLAWGAHAEGYRLKQIMQIEEQARMISEIRPQSVIIMAGDFNALDNGSAVRFLTESLIIEDKSAFWNDAWTLRGNPDNYITSEMAGLLNKQTAVGVGIKFPSLIPPRRIDYIMTRSWRFGSAGIPLMFNRFADTLYEDGLTISDHYGIYSDFLMV